MLNDLEETDFRESTEVCQKKEVEFRYVDVIQSIRLTYEAMRAFRGKSP
jgi:hypothetical protein